MTFTGGSDIAHMLQRVGELLEADGEVYAIVVLGGAALNLLGTVERTTTDVDVLAFARPEGGSSQELFQPPEPLPEALTRATRAVARDFGLPEEWLNTMAALQWRAGLPPGLARRVRWRQYAALRVGLVDRYDLIFFKLFAAIDSEGPRSVHYQDLLALAPTAEELDAAAAWVRTQDASPGFASLLEEVVGHVRRDRGLDDPTDAGRTR